MKSYAKLFKTEMANFYRKLAIKITISSACSQYQLGVEFAILCLEKTNVVAFHKLR